MRWDHLKVAPEGDTHAFPGMRDPAVIRRFEAPEALETRFYEIQAKTVLNRVPARSRMPFGWTVNPFRGCAHACSYCLDPATPVLMADGSTTPIGELESGDAILGTHPNDHRRRYVETTVTDRWPTRKAAFRIVLENGTEIVASGDHRFLTPRGWAHVTDADGPATRPHLTTGVRLLGPGAETAVRGRRVEGPTDLQVVAIEPLGVTDLCDITTGTGDFVAAGVVSHNCFARPTHEYLGFDAGRDFEREIVVKVNAPERLRADLARRARTAAYADTVALGTNTDPYQWVESKYRLLPGIWEALRDHQVPASVLTKSPLLLRDLDLMLQVQAAAGFEAALSIPSLDTKAWRATEPRTPHPRARIEAVAELARAGIPTAVLVAPLMPGINDSPAQIEALLTACTEAGAISVRGLGLHLRGSTRDVFLAWLADARPDLVPLYDELYADGAYLPPAEAARLTRLVQQGEQWGAGVVRAGRGGRNAAGPRDALPGAHADDGAADAGAQARPGPRRTGRWNGDAADGDGRDRGAGTDARAARPHAPAPQLSLF